MGSRASCASGIVHSERAAHGTIVPQLSPGVSLMVPTYWECRLVRYRHRRFVPSGLERVRQQIDLNQARCRRADREGNDNRPWPILIGKRGWELHGEPRELGREEPAATPRPGPATWSGSAAGPPLYARRVRRRGRMRGRMACYTPSRALRHPCDERCGPWSTPKR